MVASNHSEALRSNIRSLIGIFYGLAIASGIDSSAPILLKEKDLFSAPILLFAMSAFLIAISDWILYFIIVDKHVYRNIFRLILDMIFPTIIFFLFSAAKDEYYKYSVLFSLYFVLSFIYLILLVGETRYNIGKLFWVNGYCALVSLPLPFLYCRLEAIYIADMSFFLIAIPWFINGLAIISNSLKNMNNNNLSA